MRSVRGKAYLLATLLVFAAITSVYQAPDAYAAQITSRSLRLVAGATDGGSKPSGTVNHLFTFTLPGGNTVGSIKFEYCTVAQVTACVTPTGLTTTGATLGGETGVTGFSVNNATNGAPYLTRTAGAVGTSVPVTYQLNSVVNPSQTNYTFFVRISTYTATNATGSPLDTGSVAASTANPIQLEGVMPESLIFCTGVAISAPGGIPDCSTATNSVINFNQLFSPSDTATAESKMAASTNATTGYAITVNGTTMTSGSNTIPGMAAAATITRGTSEFGMNLVANTVATSTTPIGANVAPSPDATNLRGQPVAGYNTVDTFKFVSGDTVAQSNNGGAGPTNAQIYTASYIVNVAGNQLSGTYTTTLTYICTPTF